MDQRAWVGPFQTVPEWTGENNKPIYIKKGFRYRIGVDIINSGKTPAINLRAQFKVTSLRKHKKFSPVYEEGGSGSLGVLQPNAKYKLITKPSRAEITSSHIELIKNGELKIYLHGEIVYEDIFGVVHHTTFCDVLAPTLDSFDVCSGYNEAE